MISTLLNFNYSNFNSYITTKEMKDNKQENIRNITMNL